MKQILCLILEFYQAKLFEKLVALLKIDVLGRKDLKEDGVGQANDFMFVSWGILQILCSFT